MKLIIKNLTGRTVAVPYTPTDCVFDLKVRFGELADIPWDSQRLIYEGKQLEDDRSLAQYNISMNPEVEPIIYLVLRLRGGVRGHSSH